MTNNEEPIFCLLPADLQTVYDQLQGDGTFAKLDNDQQRDLIRKVRKSGQEIIYAQFQEVVHNILQGEEPTDEQWSAFFESVRAGQTATG